MYSVTCSHSDYGTILRRTTRLDKTIRMLTSSFEINAFSRPHDRMLIDPHYYYYFLPQDKLSSTRSSSTFRSEKVNRSESSWVSSKRLPKHQRTSVLFAPVKRASGRAESRCTTRAVLSTALVSNLFYDDISFVLCSIETFCNFRSSNSISSRFLHSM